jgi:hypothetical protein
MHWQTWLVAVIVLACSAHAAWRLMPAALRRRAAQAALRLPWPAAVERRLARSAQVRTGCACDGCDAAARPKAANRPATQPVRFQRRR